MKVENKWNFAVKMHSRCLANVVVRVDDDNVLFGRTNYVETAIIDVWYS